MMPRVLILQHGTYCPPGTLGDHLAADHVDTTIVELDKGQPIPNLVDFDILMAMGGAMDVWEEDANPWLVSEKAAIRKWVREFDRPYLGVCLGHQLLADALGGRVARCKEPEVALLEIALSTAGRRHALFSGFGASKRAVQWHGAEVTKLPPGGQVLASSSGCPISAFEVGSAAYGIQYHAEATDQSISDWSAVPTSNALLERIYGPGAAARLKAQVIAAMPELRANSRRLFDNFMRIARARLAA